MNNKATMWIGIGVAFFAGVVVGFVAMRQRAIGTMEAYKLVAQRQIEEAKKMYEEKSMSGSQNAMTGKSYTLETGKLMLIDGENKSLVNATVTLDNGTTITVKGLVTKTDGETVQLKDGQSVKEDGSIMDSEGSSDSMMESGTSDTMMKDNNSQ